jgi:uncharacterized membrane protein YciS (DUF1049 family)
MFLLHSTLVKTWFAILNCLPASEHRAYLVADMGVECWVGDHLDAVIFSITVGSLWVWILPLISFALMMKYKDFIRAHIHVNTQEEKKENKQEKEQIAKQDSTGKYTAETIVFIAFSHITGGYRKKYHWWELVVLLKKSVMAMVNVFKSNYPALHSTIPLLFCSVFMVHHAYALPFTRRDFNALEFFGMVNTYLTFYGGVLLHHEQFKQETWVGGIIAVSNVGFLLGAFVFMAKELRLEIQKWRAGTKTKGQTDQTQPPENVELAVKKKDSEEAHLMEKQV